MNPNRVYFWLAAIQVILFGRLSLPNLPIHLNLLINPGMDGGCNPITETNQMAANLWDIAPITEPLPVVWNDMAPADLVDTRTWGANNFPRNCPRHNGRPNLGIKSGVAGGTATPIPDVTPLLAKECYSCPIIASCYPQEQWQRALLPARSGPMIDTLTLRFPVYLEDDQMVGWKSVRVIDKGYDHFHREQYVKLDNGSTFYLTYYPNCYVAGPSLFVRFSLPRILHGSNLLLAPTLEQAINYVLSRWLASQTFLNSIHGKPSYLSCTFTITIRLGIWLPTTLLPFRKFLTSTASPLSIRVRASNTSVRMPPAGFTTRVWSSKNPVAKGILRQEASLRVKKIKKAIKDLTGEKKPPRLQDITEELMYSILEDDQAALRILDRPFANMDGARKLLIDHYGPSQGMRLFAFLQTRRDLSSNEYIVNELGCTPRTVQKAFKQIADAGIVPGLTDAPTQLPPLTLRQRPA